MEAPKLPSIFKQPRSRGFDYKPMHYDEAKERKEELRKMSNGESIPLSKDNFGDRVRANWSDHRGKQVGASNTRLVAIILFFVAVLYLIIVY